MVEEERRFVFSDYGTTGSSVNGIRDKARETFDGIRKDKKHSILQTKR